MANTYLSIFDYLRSNSGHETASLYGNLLRINGSVTQGATSLPVTPNTTVQLNVYDPITIFDGASSEVVTVQASTAPGASSITLQSGTQYAHASGTPCCSDGTYGSLAEAIIDASAEVERICNQPLLQATYTNESLSLRTTRAIIDNKNSLLVRPRQFPVTSVSALSFLFATSNTVTLDSGQVLIDSMARFFTVPLLKALGASGSYGLGGFVDPTKSGNVQLTYQAGYTYAALPWQIRRAAVWLVSDLLTDRLNPTGSATTTQGKLTNEVYLRGDLSGDNALVKRARGLLLPYSQSAW